jgi:hypothetical protein
VVGKTVVFIVVRTAGPFCFVLLICAPACKYNLQKAGRGFDKKKKLNPAVVFDMAKRSDYILGMSRRKQARREYFLTKKVNEEKAAKLESRKERRDAVKKAYEEQLHTAGLKVQLTRGPNQEEDVAIPDDESGSGGESSSDDDGGAEVFDDEHTTGRFGSEVVVTTTIGFDAPEESSKEIDDEMAEMMKVRKAELVLRKERAVAKIQKKNLKLRVAAPRKNGLLPAKKVCLRHTILDNAPPAVFAFFFS